MVYTYSAPFETGNLKVSDVHSLQSVSCLSLSLTSPPALVPFSCRVLVDEGGHDSYEVSGNRDGAPGAYRIGFCAPVDWLTNDE